MDRRVTREEVQGRIGSIPNGFTLHFEPSAGILPEALKTLRLDAVATDGRHGVVYEIVVGRRALQDEARVEKLRRLRKAIQSTPGWSFELIILPEPPPETLPLSDVDKRVSEIQSTLAVGFEESRNSVVLDGLFLISFALLESCMAMIAFAADVDYQPLAARIGAVLTEEGILDQDQLDQIRNFQNVRNGLAHGSHHVRATMNDVINLLALVREIRRLADQPIAG
ncbi:hypothetical protein [Micromonospora arida]|uniref:hypothetical protein n=1 Tax=Micromonospora arida TaxID=2203715 RepID=UPI003CEE19E3